MIKNGELQKKKKKKSHPRERIYTVPNLIFILLQVEWYKLIKGPIIYQFSDPYFHHGLVLISLIIQKSNEEQNK